MTFPIPALGGLVTTAAVLLAAAVVAAITMWLERSSAAGTQAEDDAVAPGATGDLPPDLDIVRVAEEITRRSV